MYVWANDQIVSAVTKNNTSNSTEYIHKDHLGSTKVITDVSGNILSLFNYTPFGEELILKNNSSVDRHFIGERFDEETQMSYLNARYYEGSRGQFLSEDPSHLAIGDPGKVKALTGMDMQKYLADPQLLNSYSYARNNPIVNSDPTGNATYIWNNGASMSGIDTWDTNTYYQSQDQALLQNNAAVMSSPGNYANLGAFYDRVRNGAEGDYKNQSRSYYFYRDEVVDKETFGNRNYGYAGTAAGFGKTLLKGAAGYAQVRSSNAQLKDARTYFDDPKDTANIQIGISSYNSSNRPNPASAFQIGVQTTANSKALNSIYRQLQSIQRQVNSLMKKIGR